MKKKIVGFILTGTILSLGLSTVLFSPKKAVVESKGYSASSLPTTIDLNDTSASNIRSYYSSLNNLSTSERKGTNLLKNLKTILENGQKYYSYENGTSIWQMYEITDRDWDKSPASSTTYGTYNSSTNKITNYTYGTSASSSKNNPYIHALYINRNVENQTTAWDDHQQTQWGINREHVWPKAEGFDTSGAGGARGDPMHLMAGNGYANNIHSNNFYGYVKTSDSYTDCGSKYPNQSGNLRGTSKTLNTGTVFEPQDSDKGDIARAVFYMVARYNYLSGSDSDGIDTNNPNLTLTQNISDWSSSGYTSSTSTTGKMGILTDLLAWHHADPVDEFEIHRNNLLYTNFTNNRNPFIDFPQWVDFIWGTATYNGTTYQSYSSTPTGYATPSSDTINGYNSGSSVAVTGVSLNKSSTSLVVGNSETLTATITPSNASNQSVTWSSSNTTVATVSNGLITAKKAGSATITVTTVDGSKKATCAVTVTNATKTLSSISISGQKTEYSLGDEFVKPTVTAIFSDSSTSDVTSSATFTGFDSSETGQQTITVSYTYAGVTKTTTYSVTISSSGTDTSKGSANIANGAASGWENVGTGSAYSDGAIKMDGGGDYIYKLDIFSGEESAYMTNLSVTINGKINGTPTDSNSYKVEAISGSSIDSVFVHDSSQKTGSGVFISGEYNDVVFDLSSNLSGTTGIRITYVTKGGGNWGVKGISWVATYTTGGSLDPTSILANVSRTFYVGETITKSDINVYDNFNRPITDFNFDSYTFKYEDTPGGGNNLFEKDFDLEYEGLETTLSVNIQRKPYETLDTSIVHTGAEYQSAGIVGEYTEDQNVVVDGIAFRVDGYIFSSKLSLSKNKSSALGSIINTSPYPNSISNVVVSGATPDVQLSTNGSTWVDLSSATPNTIDYYYLKIFYKNTTVGSYVNIAQIEVILNPEFEENLANYIMYEDTNNQCLTKFSVAKGYFENLTKGQRSSFMLSNDYNIATARTRLQAWARSLGKTISQSNGDYVFSNLQFNVLDLHGSLYVDYSIVVMISILTAGLGSIIAYYFLKRRKEEK